MLEMEIDKEDKMSLDLKSNIFCMHTMKDYIELYLLVYLIQ